jgi:hypothetical protein
MIDTEDAVKRSKISFKKNKKKNIQSKVNLQTPAEDLVVVGLVVTVMGLAVVEVILFVVEATLVVDFRVVDVGFVVETGFMVEDNFVVVVSTGFLVDDIVVAVGAGFVVEVNFAVVETGFVVAGDFDVVLVARVGLEVCVLALVVVVMMVAEPFVRVL